MRSILIAYRGQVSGDYKSPTVRVASYWLLSVASKDPVSQALGNPMRMYVDDHLACSWNEPTINCNAPLIFALAAKINQH